MANLKQLSKKQEKISSGHRACIGCLPMVGIRQVMRAVDDPVVVGFATGCMEVISTIYPYTAWRVPYIHNAFENCGATTSGVETAYRSLVKQGKLKDRNAKFIGFGGDGGTYDIGLQSLSGAMERGHQMLYVCYNNEAYMNTGVQRSSATPFGAFTNTEPNGTQSMGKSDFTKDLTQIMAAHHIPYVAQVSVHNWRDLYNKVQKALACNGPAFINMLSPCTLGWKFPAEKGVEIAKLAADTCFWPLYEVENGKYKITYMPKEKLPLTKYTETQGRFRHLRGEKGEEVLKNAQANVDERWEELKKLAGVTE